MATTLVQIIGQQWEGAAAQQIIIWAADASAMEFV